jgi:FkbM family methyltransferase
MKHTPYILLIIILLNSSCHAITYYSQSKQDKFVNNKFFHNMKGGVFVDIGAHDGIRYSNTYAFEKFLGWNGLCVEPNPTLFAKLQCNRTTFCVNGCISNIAGKASFLSIKNRPGTQDGPDFLSGLMESYDPQHLTRIDREIAQTGATKEIIEVQCYLLNELLELHQLYQIDYLSLDIEGGELSVLQSIDYDRFKISIIDVENNYTNYDFRRFLKTKGFILVRVIDADEIYLHPANLRAQVRQNFRSFRSR